jgi:triacylglycerol esterase/lipase EstA (alpha/beta hydrolase family)
MSNNRTIDFNENIELIPFTLKALGGQLESSAMAFLPNRKTAQLASVFAFTHGYSTSKSSIFAWGTRLAEDGHAGVIFDLPGHLAGNTSTPLTNFEQFYRGGLDLFEQGYQRCLDFLSERQHPAFTDRCPITLGGHSLGALMSLLAQSKTSYWQDKEVKTILVGLGINPTVEVHLFDTPFFEKTMNVRRQLVDPVVDSTVIFPWIKEQKENLDITGADLYALTGEDDVVVGKGALSIWPIS